MSEVTPPQCTSSFTHSCLPSSASWQRILPSAHPVKITSPVKQTALGSPVVLTWHAALAATA